MSGDWVGPNKSFGGAKLTSVADPTADQDAATKFYVDASIRGLKWKDAVRAASTGNQTISSAPSALDGVTLVTNDRVLLKDQTTPSQNGIYQFNGAGSAFTRTTDADTSAKLVSASVMVAEGTTQADTQWTQTANAPITVGTTALAFAQIGGSNGAFSVAGAGLVSTGSTVAVGAGTGIVANADDVAIDTAVVVRKYAVTIGDGATNPITATHNLGTRDVTVAVYGASTPYAEVECSVKHDTTSTVILEFLTAPTTNQYRVVVHA